MTPLARCDIFLAPHSMAFPRWSPGYMILLPPGGDFQYSMVVPGGFIPAEPGWISLWLSGKESPCQYRSCKVQSLVREDPLEKEMAAQYCSIPWTAEPSRL